VGRSEGMDTRSTQDPKDAIAKQAVDGSETEEGMEPSMTESITPSMDAAASEEVPVGKMQLRSAGDDQDAMDQEHVHCSSAPRIMGGSHLLGKMQLLGNDTAKRGSNRNNLDSSKNDLAKRKVGDSDTPGHIESGALIHVDPSLQDQPGAFFLIPGLPPIRAGNDIEDEDSVEEEDQSNTLTPGAKSALVMDAILVEDDTQLTTSHAYDLQQATEVDPSELPARHFRRRAFGLVVLVTVIVTVATTVGVIVGNKGRTAGPSVRRITFKQFCETLLPVESCQQAALDPLSAQGRALDWLERDAQGLSVVDWRMLQRYALAMTFFSLNGNGWFNGSEWLSSSDECSWFRTVDTGSYRTQNSRSCDKNGRFVSLQLQENNLTGFIPHELSLLADLQVFDLSDNAIEGIIPTSIFSLGQVVYFDLSSNNLEGVLSTNLGNMRNLSSFVVSGNNLSGTIPSEIGMLSTLITLTVDRNEFEGSLPATLGLMTKLGTIYANENMFNGSLPVEMGGMSSLKWLELSKNRLSGTIPTEFGRLQRLEYIGMASNIDVHGRIPSQFGLLSSLTQLLLGRTNLTGTIPSEL
jgi:Leucine rich repeat